MTEAKTSQTEGNTLEQGLSGDKELAQELSQEIAESWPEKHMPSTNPFFLIIGGFQGSGKTTTLEKLADSLDFVTIFPDEIRGECLPKNIT